MFGCGAGFPAGCTTSDRSPQATFRVGDKVEGSTGRPVVAAVRGGAQTLTIAQREQLAELAAMPDEAIDTCDIPELSDEAWSADVRGRFYRPVKQQITARVDADALDWLKSQGKGRRAA